MISLNMLLERLEAYRIESQILYGDREIKRIRLLSTEFNTHRESSTLYIVPKKGRSAGQRKGLLLLHENDTAFVHAHQPEKAYNDIFAAFELYGELFARAEKHISEGKDLQGLLALLAEILMHNVFVVDKMQRVIASAGNHGYSKDNEEYERYLQEHRHLPIEIMNAMLRNWNQTSTSRGAQRFHNPALPSGGVYRNLFVAGENIAYLLFPEDIGQLSPAEMQMADIIGGYIERWFESTSSQMPLSESNIFCRILEDTLDDSTDMSLFMTILNWDNRQNKELICINSLFDHSHGMNFTFGYFRELFAAYHTFVYRNNMCLIHDVDEKHNAAFYSRLSQNLSQLNSYAGVSYPFNELCQIKSALNQAEIGIRYGNKRQGAVNYCKDNKLAHIKKTLTENLDFDISAGELQTLKDHDTAYNTEYYNTLHVYLLNERNQRETARQLGIHRNTLNQRIRKIEELIDAKLDDNAFRLQLLLSYYINEET